MCASAGGDLVLESPAHPVPEGNSMALSCFSLTANITIEAEFYKDDILLDVTDEMIIPAVSKADEGNYTCKSLEEDIFSKEESPDTWILVISESTYYLLLILSCVTYVCCNYRCQCKM